MSRPYYGDNNANDYYYHQEDYSREQPSSGRSQRQTPQHSPAARDGMQGQSQLRPEQRAKGRGPRRTHQHHHQERSAWDTSQEFHEGGGYEDVYDQYGEQSDYAWPIPTHVQPPRNHASPRRGPPLRPQRPDEINYQQSPRNNPRHAGNGKSHPDYPSYSSNSHHGSGQWTGDGYSYAGPAYPFAGRSSEDGSMTAIPQYVPPHMPQQAAYGQGNRRAPLGPPPSARRGPFSYYPQVGPVHPIVEETDSMRSSHRMGSSVHTGGNDSKTSFASSNAIPIGIPQGVLDAHAGSRPHTQEQSSQAPHHEIENAFDDLSPGQEEEWPMDSPPLGRGQPNPGGMVRKASLGQKSKPKLTTVRHSDKGKTSSVDGVSNSLSQQRASIQSEDKQDLPADTTIARAKTQQRLEGRVHAGADVFAESGSDQTVVASTPGSDAVKIQAATRTQEDVLGSGTGLLDPSSSESENESRKHRSKELLAGADANGMPSQESYSRSSPAPDNDERVRAILEGLRKGGAINAEEAEELKKPMAGLSERPGKHRPPRLNVEGIKEAQARGSLTSLPELIKRATRLASNLDRGKTASRLGIMNWVDGADDEKRASGSISDMLSAFPPPLATPPASRNERRSFTAWSSRLRHSTLPSNSDAGEFQKKQPRRRCGMPMWLFVLVMLLLLLLVAAAVVVPVMLLVVVPNDSNHGVSDPTCSQTITCENGGATILSSNGVCQCLCVNGYTGLNCTDHSEQGCTTTSIGTMSDATVGSAIPRLISGSSNFSIPLNGQALLGLFSASNLDCASQNALITFNGASSKRHAVQQRWPERVVAMDVRDVSSGTSTTASSTSSSATATSTAIVDSDTAIDFARIAVLYVLQVSSQLNTAATAQTDLQNYFRSGEDSNGNAINARNVTLGNDYACDLITYSLSLQNGTTVGGTS